MDSSYDRVNRGIRISETYKFEYMLKVIDLVELQFFLVGYSPFAYVTNMNVKNRCTGFTLNTRY